MKLIIIFISLLFIVILYTNIFFYRVNKAELDYHKLNKITKDDLKQLYKLRQPIKINYKIECIDDKNFELIFNKKNVLNLNIKNGKMTYSKWKKENKKHNYKICTFKSNKNKLFNPLLMLNTNENYIILDKND